MNNKQNIMAIIENGLILLRDGGYITQPQIKRITEQIQKDIKINNELKVITEKLKSEEIERQEHFIKKLTENNIKIQRKNLKYQELKQ